MRPYILLLLLLLCSLYQPARAAFPVISPIAVPVADTPVMADTTARHHGRQNGMREWAKHKKWYGRHDLATWAWVCAITGIAAAVAFFYVLPVSAAGAVIFFVLSGAAGYAALGLSEMDILSAHRHGTSEVTMILGILEAIPISVAAIPVSIIWSLIPHTHSKKQTDNKNSK